MEKIVEIGITRRAANTAAAVGGISLLMPKGALAAEPQTLDRDWIDYFVRPDLSEDQFDAMLRERAKKRLLKSSSKPSPTTTPTHKPNRSLNVTGFAVDISGPGFYKATANVIHKIQPYVVYETKNGVRRVYAKMASNTFFDMALGKRRVG